MNSFTRRELLQRSAMLAAAAPFGIERSKAVRVDLA
jgi:hypothetical protein